MKALFQPYKMASNSVKELVKLLGFKRINMNASTYNPKTSHVLINWGSKKKFPYVRYINDPDAVALASNKLSTFKKLNAAEVPTVEWTQDKATASAWLAQGHIVLARLYLTASQGAGINVITPDTNEVVSAPLYTKYKKKKKEFRVHVFDGEVLFVQEKRKRKDMENVDFFIRNYDRGWVFCREDIQEPNDLRLVAIKAVIALGLDFGAVDIIWNAKENKCYVLEVNTAPGLEGSSILEYANKIKAYLQKLKNAQQISNTVNV